MLDIGAMRQLGISFRRNFERRLFFKGQGNPTDEDWQNGNAYEFSACADFQKLKCWKTSDISSTIVEDDNVCCLSHGCYCCGGHHPASACNQLIPVLDDDGDYTPNEDIFAYLLWRPKTAEKFIKDIWLGTPPPKGHKFLPDDEGCTNLMEYLAKHVVPEPEPGTQWCPTPYIRFHDPEEDLLHSVAENLTAEEFEKYEEHERQAYVDKCRNLRKEIAELNTHDEQLKAQIAKASEFGLPREALEVSPEMALLDHTRSTFPLLDAHETETMVRNLQQVEIEIERLRQEHMKIEEENVHSDPFQDDQESKEGDSSKRARDSQLEGDGEQFVKVRRGSESDAMSSRSRSFLRDMSALQLRQSRINLDLQRAILGSSMASSAGWPSPSASGDWKGISRKNSSTSLLQASGLGSGLARSPPKSQKDATPKSESEADKYIKKGPLQERPSVADYIAPKQLPKPKPAGLLRRDSTVSVLSQKSSRSTLSTRRKRHENVEHQKGNAIFQNIIDKSDSVFKPAGDWMKMKDLAKREDAESGFDALQRKEKLSPEDSQKYFKAKADAEVGRLYERFDKATKISAVIPTGITVDKMGGIAKVAHSRLSLFRSPAYEETCNKEIPTPEFWLHNCTGQCSYVEATGNDVRGDPLLEETAMWGADNVACREINLKILDSLKISNSTEARSELVLWFRNTIDQWGTDEEGE